MMLVRQSSPSTRWWTNRIHCTTVLFFSSNHIGAKFSCSRLTVLPSSRFSLRLPNMHMGSPSTPRNRDVSTPGISHSLESDHSFTAHVTQHIRPQSLSIPSNSPNRSSSSVTAKILELFLMLSSGRIFRLHKSSYWKTKMHIIHSTQNMERSQRLNPSSMRVLDRERRSNQGGWRMEKPRNKWRFTVHPAVQLERRR